MKILLIAFMMVPLAAQAQKKEIQMDFEKELIEGELKAPEVELVKTTPTANHKKLLTIRENFLKEMEQTSLTVK